METVSQMLQHPAQTGKEIFMFHHRASWSGERANVPPEPLFSLCHLLVLLLSLSLSLPRHGVVWKQRAERGGGGEGRRISFECYVTPTFRPAQKIALTEVAAKVSPSPIPFHCGVHVCADSER